MEEAIIQHLVLPHLTENPPSDLQITESACELPQDTNIVGLTLLGNLDLEGKLGWKI